MPIEKIIIERQIINPFLFVLLFDFNSIKSILFVFLRFLNRSSLFLLFSLKITIITISLLDFYMYFLHNFLDYKYHYL